MKNKLTPEEKELITALAEDRWLAHSFIFEKRHPLKSPLFHEEMVELFRGPEKRVAMMTFRDGAKSTIAEEEIVLGALYQEFSNCLIIGSSFDRACDRLRSVKNELANNDKLLKVYGNQTGAVWAESKIELKNGVVIQAFGREQSLRGCKHLDVRPDFCVIDDLEDEETSKSLEAISRCIKWFMSVLIPALQGSARIRMIGTPLHPRCVIVQLSEDREWIDRVWPIEYMNENGRVPAWPEKFPLETIDEIRGRNMRLGTMGSFNQEYMCKAEDEDAKPFKPEMVKVLPQPRSWQGVWACYDPARTVNTKTSAQTGKAVWSWIGNRLVVWEASGHFWRPDEIIDDIMQTNREYNPVGIGVEKEGLEEFIMQPLRQAMVKNREIVPLVPIKAPAGKIDFIRGLQPFFMAGEIVLAKEMPDLVAQMMAFPSGLKDILNALAYALKMRPGLPVYEDFTDRHAGIPKALSGKPYWLCLNAEGGLASGVLCQYEHGSMKIFADWVREGEHAESLKDIIEFALLESEGRMKVIAFPKTLDPYSNSGMKMAALHKNVVIRRGAEPDKGREHIRTMLRSQRAGTPEILVSSGSTWTLRAFAGGYALDEGVPVNGPYRILMEGLESFIGLVKAGFASDDDRNYATASNGRRYLSSLPR